MRFPFGGHSVAERVWIGRESDLLEGVIQAILAGAPNGQRLKPVSLRMRYGTVETVPYKDIPVLGGASLVYPEHRRVPGTIEAR